MHSSLGVTPNISESEESKQNTEFCSGWERTEGAGHCLLVSMLKDPIQLFTSL
jgi:hypothetical protein